MANYNLGSVQGEVRITYNGRGVKDADEDLKHLGETSAKTSKATDDVGKTADKAGEKVRKFGKDADSTEKSIAKLGRALTAVSKIPVLVGAAADVIQFAGAVAPAVGVVAALPGALLSVAAAGATVKIATVGMGDAFKAVASGDAAALEKALAKLSPEARAFVKEVAALKPAWNALRLNVQNALFQDLSVTVRDLGRTYLPVLNTGFVDIAKSMNVAARVSAKALMQPETVAALGRVLDATSLSTANLGAAAGHTLSGLINMGSVGAEYLAILSYGSIKAAEDFDRWTQSAEGQQKVNDWINTGVGVLKQLWQILQNLGNIAQGVWAAMNEGSGGVLENLIALTAQVSEWVNSAQGQETLVAIFNALHQIMVALLPIIGGIVLFVGQLAQWFSSLPAPVQSAIAQFIAFSLVIGKLLSLGAPVIGFFIKNSAEIAKFGGWLSKLGGWIGTAISWIVRMGSAFLANAARVAASWLIAMGPIGWVIAAVIALVALIIIYWDEIKAATIAAWTAVSSWLTQAWEWIKATALSVWGAITTFFTSIWDGIVAVWNAIWAVIGGTVTTIWNGIVAFLQGVWNVIFEIFRFAAIIILALFFTIFNPIWEAVQIIWNAIVAFLSAVWNGLVALATAVWTAIVSAVTTAWNAIWAFLQPILQTIGTAISTAWNAIVSLASTVWNAVSSTVSAAWNAIYGFISTQVNAAWQVIQSVWNTVMNFLSGIWNSISGAASSLWNQIYNAIKGPIDRIWQSIVDIGNRIKGIAGEALNWLVSAGKNIVTGLWNGIASLGSWLYSKIIAWARSVIPGPILQFLGIASPSKFMRDEVGKNIPPGVAEGIDAKSQIATAAAAAMAAKVGEAARTATDQELSVRTSLLPSSALSSLPADLQARLGNLGLAASSAGITGGSVATASTPATTSSTSNKSTVIDKLVLDVKGIIDPTDPVSWRNFGEEVRELLTEVEASYR
ncbi:MAG: hypothetical protein AB7L09_22250 [Nitrospira sp.]